MTCRPEGSPGGSAKVDVSRLMGRGGGFEVEAFRLRRPGGVPKVEGESTGEGNTLCSRYCSVSTKIRCSFTESYKPKFGISPKPKGSHRTTTQIFLVPRLAAPAEDCHDAFPWPTV
jgi:hypothetical protein